MSAEGQNILNLFRQTRQVCEQVSLLLQTADEQMKKADWKPDKSLAVSDMSYSVLSPTQWIPIAAFRYYFNQKYRNLIACVSVLLCDHFDEKYTLKEPVVTGLCFDYGKGHEETIYEYWYARYFGYLSNNKPLELNGEPFEFDNRNVDQDHKGNFEKGVLFALPLISLKNGQDVKLRVTDRLLGLLKDGTLSH